MPTPNLDNFPHEAMKFFSITYEFLTEAPQIILDESPCLPQYILKIPIIILAPPHKISILEILI